MKILELLEEEKIFDIYAIGDGKFNVVERCDNWLSVSLTKDQLLQLAEEIRELANSDKSERNSDPL